MQCKVTKVMAKTLQKYIKKYQFEYIEMSAEQYELYVGYDLLEHENDFDWNKGRFKVIRVIYPLEYYACDSYLTTNDLVRLAKQGEDLSINTFMKNVFHEIEI